LKIHPLNNFVLVEVNDDAEKTSSGIIVPRKKGERTEAFSIPAVVIAIGKFAKRYRTPLGGIANIEFKEGDKVLVAKWEGQLAEANTKNYILIKPEHVMALLK